MARKAQQHVSLTWSLVAVVLYTIVPACYSIIPSYRGVSRRSFALVAGGAIPTLVVVRPGADVASAASPALIADRFTMTILPEPPVKQRSELNIFSGQGGLYDDLFYPAWMDGNWSATQTLMAFDAPLGARFLAGPSGLRTDVAEATIAEQRSKVGVAVGPFPLHWLEVSPPLKNAEKGPRFVVEDRKFNTRARLNAFAGREVVKNVNYVEVGGANKLVYGDAPLPTTLTRFRGTAVQKTFSNNRGSEVDPTTGAWTGFEFTRTLFARTDSDAPPVVADQQVITQLARDEATGTVTGQIRVADYLSPNDQLFFDARQRAVSISDYKVYLEPSP